MPTDRRYEGSGYPCPCGGPTRVIDSRYQYTRGRLRRRRRCLRCATRFTTYEHSHNPPRSPSAFDSFHRFTDRPASNELSTG